MRIRGSLSLAVALLAATALTVGDARAQSASQNFKIPVQTVASTAGVSSGAGKRITSNVGVLSDQGGASSATFDARSGFLSSFDLAPPGFVVGLLENTTIKNQIHVSVLATEPLLADPAFALTVDGSPRSLAFSRVRAGLYVGELEISGSSANYALTVSGRDAYFNQGTSIERFGAAPAGPTEGGSLTSADGAVSLSWGEGAIALPGVLWMREPATDAAAGALSFRIEPVDLAFERSSRIALDAGGIPEAADTRAAGFRLLREADGEAVPFYSGANPGEGTALVTRLGGYRFERASGKGGGRPIASDHLLHSFPNPFNPVTTIFYEVEAKGQVSLRVFDAGGRLVKTLFRGTREAGGFEAGWDGTGEDGRQVASGVYFARLETGKGSSSRKLILEK